MLAIWLTLLLRYFNWNVCWLDCCKATKLYVNF